MDAFHAHFRSTWETLYTSASSGRRAQGLSIRAFIKLGLDFVSHLETHHAIEERYVFPELARRMPEFRTGKERDLPPPAHAPGVKGGGGGGESREAAELLRQHLEIHHGMDGLRAYLKAFAWLARRSCRCRPSRPSSIPGAPCSGPISTRRSRPSAPRTCVATGRLTISGSCACRRRKKEY
ncbi:hypothetical protein F4803DRAFT_532439 [Xylaria telfairii]|nr:hypothetical protein F4803DRAFT_532439 [Xylaria telfairii]